MVKFHTDRSREAAAVSVDFSKLGCSFHRGLLALTKPALGDLAAGPGFELCFLTYYPLSFGKAQ